MPRTTPSLPHAASVVLLLAACVLAGPAHAIRPELPPEWRPVFADPPVQMGGRQNTWRMLDPISVLSVLAKHPGRVVRVFHPPPGWITPAHLERLRALSLDRATAAVVCPYRFPGEPQAMPAPRARSTVGQEARRLIAAATSGDGRWPSACSDAVGDAP